MPNRHVVITGIGLVTSLGDSLEEFSAALYERPGGRDTRFVSVSIGQTAPRPGARVASDLDSGLERFEAKLADRSTRLALLASSRALADARWPVGAPSLKNCGVFVGCGSGPTESVNASYAALYSGGRIPGLTLLRCLPNSAASAISIRHGMHGATQTYTNACASSTVAIGEAVRAIRHGYLDLALAGGTEAPFSDGSFKAWEALRVLAPLGGDAGAACRPFDRFRRGIVLGEGAVFFVMEALEVASARGANAHALIAGYAATSDGHHWTEPSLEGQVRTIASALEDAQLSPRDVGCINAHGTGTLLGDQIESNSIEAVFGSQTAGPVVSSTKATHGHLLGASGAIELAACVVTLKTRRVPPTRNLVSPDEACRIHLVRGEPAPLERGHAVLSNTFAFGGSNACLVVEAA